MYLDPLNMSWLAAVLRKRSYDYKYRRSGRHVNEILRAGGRPGWLKG
jgi:hypothetical protein